MMETTVLKNNVMAGQLTQFMIENHPDRIMDVTFINERADRAARTFEKESLNGMSIDDAIYEANKVLYKDLLFSPFRLVRDVVTNELDYQEDDEEIDEFSLQMLDRVKPIIAKYEPDDRFEGSYEYSQLYEEIKESINQYLILNGIQ